MYRYLYCALVALVGNTAAAQSCDVVNYDFQRFYALPQVKSIENSLISSCWKKGGAPDASLDSYYVGQMMSKIVPFVYFSSNKEVFSRCGNENIYLTQKEFAAWQKMYRELKTNSYSGAYLTGNDAYANQRFSETCRSTLISLLEKGVGDSVASNTDTSTRGSSNTVSPQSRDIQAGSVQAQQQAQQAQDAARVAQTRADQARQGQRRRHEPENEASQCIQPDFGGLFGGMKNTCDFKVWYTYCGYRPKESSWLTGMNCEKQSFGSDSVGPGRTSASHTKGVESIHWIACKEPAWALDAEFVPGQGIKGRCHTVGGK